jgi:hypothetical protein
MNRLITLGESDLNSIHGGTVEGDSLARDVGQYIGGFYGSFVAHPILTNLPLVGAFVSNWCGFWAATQ